MRFYRFNLFNRVYIIFCVISGYFFIYILCLCNLIWIKGVYVIIDVGYFNKYFLYIIIFWVGVLYIRRFYGIIWIGCYIKIKGWVVIIVKLMNYIFMLGLGN